MDQLDIETVRTMDPQAWYRFLLEKYLELWREKEITVSYPVSSDAFGFGPGIETQAASAFIVDATAFWVTFRLAELVSVSLEAVSLSWDHRNKRLWVMLDRSPSPF